MSGRRLARPIGLIGAAIVGAFVAVSLRGGPAAPAAPAPSPVMTATAVRTDLESSVLTGGTLAYAPAGSLVNQLSGTYTQLPAVGRTIKPGQALYRVNNLPAVLMSGETPAWRPFALGMTDGPDVSELQANLIAFGDGDGLHLRPTGRYDWATADAVERWQLVEHEPVTSEIALGDVVFLPSAVRVGTENVAPGQAASPAQTPYQATTTTRTVSVPLTPNLPSARLGERVSIVLPSAARIPGDITTIGPPPPATPSGSGGSGGSQGSIQLTVMPDRAVPAGAGAGVAVQVSLTISSARDVLAVPVSALLALAGGGYGVEVVEPSGVHRLVAVHTGMFAGSRVQVTGTGIQPGTRVVVAQ